MLKKPVIARPPSKKADDFVRAGNVGVEITAPDGKVVKFAEITAGTKPTPKLKRLTIDIAQELHQKFKLRAVAGGVDMRDIMSDLIQGYVDGKK